MGKRARRAGLVLVACLGLGVASSAAVGMATAAGAAGASTGTSPAPSAQSSGTFRAGLEAHLSARQQKLGELTTLVNEDDRLSTPVRQTLSGQLSAATSGIDALVQEVPGAPATQLSTLAGQMVSQYRVYAVMAPKVHLCVRAAHQLFVEQKVTAAEPAIAARISAAKAAGATVTAVEAAYQSLVGAVQDASSDTAGADVTAVLAVTAAGFPGNATVLTTAHSQLAAARAQVPGVRQDVRTLRQAARSSRRSERRGRGRRSAGTATSGIVGSTAGGTSGGGTVGGTSVGGTAGGTVGGTTAPTRPVSTAAPSGVVPTAAGARTGVTSTPTIGTTTSLTGTLFTLGTFTGPATVTSPAGGG